jgi:hypothetical protein
MSEALFELEPHQIGTSLLLSFIIKHAKQALNYEIFLLLATFYSCHTFHATSLSSEHSTSGLQCMRRCGFFFEIILFS